VRALADMSEVERKVALERYKLLEPHLQNGRELRSVSEGSGVSFRTLQRWVSGYKREGLVGLVRKGRIDFRCLSEQFRLSLWCSAAIAEQIWLVPSLVFLSETWMKHTELSKGLTAPLCMELTQTAVCSANLRELSFAGSWTIFSFCLPGTQVRSSTRDLPIPTISISSSEKRASE